VGFPKEENIGDFFLKEYFTGALKFGKYGKVFQKHLLNKKNLRKSEENEKI